MRNIAYQQDPYGNTLVYVGGRELATKVDIGRMSELVKEDKKWREEIELKLKASLATDFHLNLLQEERDQILSELMTQLDEACR